MFRSSCGVGRGLGSSVPVDPASHRLHGRWWAFGHSFVEESKSIMHGLSNGPRKLSALTSGICRRTSSCLTAALQSILRASIPRQLRPPYWKQLVLLARTISFALSPMYLAQALVNG